MIKDRGRETKTFLSSFLVFSQLVTLTVLPTEVAIMFLMAPDGLEPRSFLLGQGL